MYFIAHRINTIQDLLKIPTDYGIEVDLRDSGNNIILQHDPFIDGEDFEDYLRYFNHKTIILNIKSEQIEYRILTLLNKYNIKDYFFLDSSFGMIYKLYKKGERNIALRFSEFESLESILLMKNKVSWIWTDCFTKFPLDKKKYDIFRKAGLRICLTSPDLHGRPEDIKSYKEFIINSGILIDAICTKFHNIPLWKKLSD